MENTVLRVGNGTIGSMRNLILATLAIATLALVTSAHADRPPDLTLTWDSGEMSSDMSMWTTIISVTGTKVHYTSTYSGRNEGRPGTAPVKGDGVVKDPKRLAAALAALDKLKPSPTPKPSQNTAHRDTGCVRRTSERCAFHIDGGPTTPDYKAMVEIKAAIVDGVRLHRDTRRREEIGGLKPEPVL